MATSFSQHRYVQAAQLFVLREWLLCILLLCALPLFLLSPVPVISVPALVEWPTIMALAGLLLLTTALDVSGGLGWAARRFIANAGTDRKIALALVVLTAFSAMWLTNDVALFLVVPLTLSLCRLTGYSPVRLVVFEALAANAGSLLTPTGNPQNLFLWQNAGVSFHGFMAAMMPLTAMLLLALLALTALCFSSQKRPVLSVSDQLSVDRPLLVAALALYIPFLVGVNAGHVTLSACIVFAVIFGMRWQLVVKLDWLLLAVFALMFIDLRLLTGLEIIRQMVAGFDLAEPVRLYVASILTSQLISNVPATIALAPFTHEWKILAYGVNIGGFGLLHGSLANLIALRLLAQPGAVRQFHLYALPALVVSALIGYGLLFVWH